MRLVVLCLFVGLQVESYAQTTTPDCATGCVQIAVTRISGYIRSLTPPISDPIIIPVPAPTPALAPEPAPAPAPVPEPAPAPVSAPPPAPQALPAPAFSPQNGGAAFGSTVTLSASALPEGAVLEYSRDNGSTWTAGNQVVINGNTDLVGRVRLGEQTSASTNASYIAYYQRLLVIGNSIMNMGPAPDFGWYNNNGMAASAPEKDFVHLLTRHLQTLHPDVGVRLQSGGSFERQYGMTSYSLDEFNEPVQQFKPDLIVVRIGENIDDSQVPGRNFETHYRQLLERLANLSNNQNQPVRIICTTSVWSNPQSDAIVRRVTNEKGYTLVDLSSMVGQSQYFASQYADAAVAAHPNDAGMQRIDELIWEKLR